MRSLLLEMGHRRVVDQPCAYRLSEMAPALAQKAAGSVRVQAAVELATGLARRLALVLERGMAKAARSLLSQLQPPSFLAQTLVQLPMMVTGPCPNRACTSLQEREMIHWVRIQTLRTLHSMHLWHWTGSSLQDFRRLLRFSELPNHMHLCHANSQWLLALLVSE